jgi:uncharacterized protein YcbX
MGVVTALATTPVKGLRVVSRDALTLTAAGEPDNRRFYLVDERGRLINAKHVGELGTVVADYDHGARALTLTFPDGGAVSGVVSLGEPFDTRFFSRQLRARPLEGPWSAALSDWFGRTLRVVEGERTAVDRGRGGGVSLISRASLDALARFAGEEAIDARRFRMLVEIDGVQAHEEDTWLGSRVRIGAAVVRLHGHVGRCSITTRHPVGGHVDLPVLDLLREYRGDLDTTEPLAFGVYGEVLCGGRVARGDRVELAPAR